MPKRSGAIEARPSVVRLHLQALGENLSIARKRRRESLNAWAQRIGVSEPTLMRMENGDPSVSMGVYATALWLMGRAEAMCYLAAPEAEQGELEKAGRVARARAVRKRPSRYGAAPKKPGPQSGSGEIIVAEGGQT